MKVHTSSAYSGAENIVTNFRPAKNPYPFSITCKLKRLNKCVSDLFKKKV